jgi:diguanylate cyclase (GGDEF)-like protein/PAS domain S-box-containing protein
MAGLDYRGCGHRTAAQDLIVQKTIRLPIWTISAVANGNAVKEIPMSHVAIIPGFSPALSHNVIFREYLDDPYKSKGTLPHVQPPLLPPPLDDSYQSKAALPTPAFLCPQCDVSAHTAIIDADGSGPSQYGGTGKYCRGVLSSVTERKHVERKLHLLSKALEKAQEGIVLTDAENRIVAVNSAFSKATGYSAEEIIGHDPAILKSGLHDKAFYCRMYASLQENDTWQGEIRNRRKNGEIYTEWLNISVIRSDNGEIDYYIGVFSDSSNQDEVRTRLFRLAYYDELTGLPNRTLLYDRLTQYLVDSKRISSMMAILFIDLDGFKVVNDMHGHSAGDQLLRQIAARLITCVREGDTLSRMGGDEFVALLRNIENEQVAAQVAARMLEICAQPFLIEGHELLVTISVGISIHTVDGDNGSDLLRNADTAMYRAKAYGKNNFQFFSQSLPDRHVS